MSSPRNTHSSINSVDSCLVDILARREEKIYVPPSMRKIYIYLVIAFGWTWTFAWLAVIWQDDTDTVKGTLDVMVDISAPASLIAAFLVQYFVDYDGGWEGCMKLIRRCHPSQITRPFWCVSLFSMPATYCILNGLYTWFGGDAPETITFGRFFGIIAISMAVAILEEFGWRGIMLPDFQNCMDDWYYKQYGNCEGNDGLAIPFWAAGDGYAEINPVAKKQMKRPVSTQSRSMRIVEEGDNDNDDVDVAAVVPHWKLSPCITSVAIGFAWALWHLPVFFINDRDQTNSNFAQYLLQCIAFSFIYTWQSNSTQNSILAAIIMHCSINTFSLLDPWGDKQFPNFFDRPNCLYTILLYGCVICLVWVVGPTLGRAPPKKVIA